MKIKRKRSDILIVDGDGDLSWFSKWQKLCRRGLVCSHSMAEARLQCEAVQSSCIHTQARLRPASCHLISPSAVDKPTRRVMAIRWQAPIRWVLLTCVSYTMRCRSIDLLPSEVPERIKRQAQGHHYFPKHVTGAEPCISLSRPCNWSGTKDAGSVATQRFIRSSWRTAGACITRNARGSVLVSSLVWRTSFWVTN